MVSLSHETDLPVSTDRHAREASTRVPAAPWGSRRLPRLLRKDDPRRTLFRSLVRRAEGVPVAFGDGTTGIVDEVVLPAVGFDFWAEELVVATSEGRRRVSIAEVARIDTRTPRLVLTSGSRVSM